MKYRWSWVKCLRSDKIGLTCFIMKQLYLNPALEAGDFVRTFGLSQASVYRVIKRLEKKGMLERPDHGKPWIVNYDMIKQG